MWRLQFDRVLMLDSRETQKSSYFNLHDLRPDTLIGCQKVYFRLIPEATIKFATVFNDV